jgi:hypothetical protein
MMVVPIIMLVLPVDQITEYFRSSDLAIFFSDNNFLLHLIRGAV